MYSINDLIVHLKHAHNIQVHPGQERDLRNYGYYHGYKGYRFIKTASNRMNISNFNQVVSINKFDLELKQLVYSKIMFIETALKSYLLESILDYAQTDDLNEIFKKCLTEYQTHQRGSSNYSKYFSKRMKIQMKINSALIRDYENNRGIEQHFFNQDRPIPVWAVFESLSLGEFGSFLECCNETIRKKVSGLLSLPTNLDPNGKMVQKIIFCLRDLRNSVAHNNPIFDTRFKSGSIDQTLLTLLKTETSISSIDFEDIDSYIILICYIYNKMGMKKDCISFIHEYIRICDTILFNKIDARDYFRIFKTSHKNDLSRLEDFIRSSP
ncbi:MAG: Abi family protein [Sphaerochaetaceae bacterium]|nr:Abi family protein [Bacilli bacterium]MCF0238281.1 Abi family protein [Sphaerochaetaceae bacterium]